MKVYKIKPGGFNEVRKQILRRVLPMYVAVFTGVVLMLVFSPANKYNKKNDVNTLPFVLPFAAALLGFSYYRGISKQRPVFESYTLTISDITIIRDEDGKPTISLYHNEVTAIYRNKNGSLLIKGTEPGDIIGVPAQVEDYEELEITLQNIKPIENPPAKNALLTGITFPLIGSGSMVGVVIATNKILVAICTIVFIVLSIWSFFTIMRSKNIDPKTKRNSFWVFLVLASVTAIAVMKIFMM